MQLVAIVSMLVDGLGMASPLPLICIYNYRPGQALFLKNSSTSFVETALRVWQSSRHCDDGEESIFGWWVRAVAWLAELIEQRGVAAGAPIIRRCRKLPGAKGLRRRATLLTHHPNFMSPKKRRHLCIFWMNSTLPLPPGAGSFTVRPPNPGESLILCSTRDG
jgi:hypothetical protein